jgi:hypothetical protein
MVAGTFASVPCESVRERGRGRRPARDTSKPHAARQQPTCGSSPPAPRCRLLKRPGKRSHLACAKGGRELKRPCPPAAAVRPDPHRACPSRRHGEPRVRTIRQGLLPAPDAHATDPLDAGVGCQVCGGGCAAMSAPHWPWRAKTVGLAWRRPRCGRVVDLAGACPLCQGLECRSNPEGEARAAQGPFEEVILGDRGGGRRRGPTTGLNRTGHP